MNFLYKFFRLFFLKIASLINNVVARGVFKGNNVSFSSFRTGGFPYVMVARGGKMFIGKNFAMNNGLTHNPIGCSQRCTFFVDRGAVLKIGDNVGMASAT